MTQYNSIQILCDGVYLDLHRSAEIQFTHDNPLFAFDSIKCERTTQFKLPCTPKNDRVLSLARIPACDGVGMRRKFEAQLQMSGVVQNGYLYISEFNGEDYVAIFVTGELIGLQAIAQLGKISELMTYSNYVLIGGSVPPQYVIDTILWANVNYSKPSDEIRVPSISLKLLYNSIVTQYNINAQQIPAQLDAYRIVPPKAGGANEQEQFKSELNPNGGSQPNSSESSITDSFNLLTNSIFFESEVSVYPIMHLNVTQYYKVRKFKCKMPVAITFSDDWDDGVYLYKFTDRQNSMTSADFYGDRWFEKELNAATVTRHGSSLKGRTVNLATGDAFFFVDEDDFVNEQTNIMGTIYRDYGFTLNPEWDIQLRVTTEPSQYGDICRLQDNLPECTFVELCKTIAALTGTMLNYTDADGLTFDPVDFSTFSEKQISEVTKYGEVKRTFGDYQQRNIIRFLSNKEVSEHITLAYVIDNDNLQSEHELQQIPFSEGEMLDNQLYIRGERNSPTIGKRSSTHLVQIDLPQNAGIQALCTFSTQVKISARMTAFEYLLITAKTLLMVDNLRYVWTSKNWSRNIASFTLAKQT